MAKRDEPYHRANLEQELLAKAAEILASRGVEALSLRALGRSAGVSRSAAYHYFPDKATLLAKVGERGFRRLGERIAGEAAGAASPLDELRQGLHGYLRFALEEPHFFRLMFANLLARPVAEEGAGLRFSSEDAQRVFGTLLGGIQGLQQQGLLRPGDPLLLLNVLWAFTHGVAVLALDHNLKGYDGPQVLAAGLTTLLAGLAAKP
jgi:AcrR family transcriptional regulator